ncbi:M23 family metallopeptidase [Microbacterium dauci]|uniref:M23 family metallopeptidase n=1 Tax=Microbacterium dauci TaxID=3048008 RepID=A0ABT6ZHC9_9MICO|nr:M23 family metallopeptidase [Microbacterium sp. LX3-4]MDJ1115348.1 M23 family metallopeptidase [Microbacterium sp. LX3-4]
MALTDAPTVRIAGVTLAAEWSTTKRIALAGLRITWGRRNQLERAAAAQLYLEVLDTDGHLSSATHLTGQRITVTRADGRVIYRGRLDDYALEQRTVTDPANGAARRVWLLKLSAGCKIAELGQAIVPGPGNDPEGIRELGPGYWPPGTVASRVEHIMDAGAENIVDSIAWSNPYPATPQQPLVRWHAFGDGLSLLELIERLYQAHPLAYVLYRPSDNSIDIGQPTETSGLALKYVGGMLRVDFIDGIPGRAVPARTVVLPNGKEATTGLRDAIDVVQVTTPKLATWLEDVTITVEHETTRNSVDLGRREHRVENDVFTILVSEANTGDFVWPFPLDYVSAEFGPRPGIGDGFHDGIDFAGGTAFEGADVKAAAPGKYAGKRTHPDWGNNVIIDHGLDANGDRLRTFYAHLQEQPEYATGEPIEQGDVVGTLGNTGLSTGPHLHYETQVNGVSINPRNFMANRQYGTQPDDTYIDTWQRSLAAETADMLDQLNEKLTLPTVRFDFRKFEYHSTIEELAIETYVRSDRALYFPGSVFNVALDAAAAHQLIGGTLVYHEGWTADVTLAPAMLTAEGVTVAQLCASTEPTLDDFDPDLTIADLGNVTQGVPA